MSFSADDQRHMRWALHVAARGQGFVEPNPMVGCVLLAGGRAQAGWHGRFGGPHAEIEALRRCPDPRGAEMFVTLEPCCHHGKTPPCVEAIVAAQVARVVVAHLDPFPQVAGQGVAALRAAGTRVEVGLCEPEARALNAPYLKLLATGLPFGLAKWAMTLDGKLATRSHDSQWISSPASRRVAHALRGRVDAVVIGRGTAEADDPLLTARPPGPRVATRVVLDSQARLAPSSQLARTARRAPVLVAVGPAAPAARRAALADLGCEIVELPAGAGADSAARADRARALFAELGRRRFSNVLVEGGAAVLGACFDADLIDEAHVFIAPKLVGGGDAPSPLAGQGFEWMRLARSLRCPTRELLEDDVYIHGRLGPKPG